MPDYNYVISIIYDFLNMVVIQQSYQLKPLIRVLYFTCSAHVCTYIQQSKFLMNIVGVYDKKYSKDSKYYTTCMCTQWCGNSLSYRTIVDKSSECPVN